MDPLRIAERAFPIVNELRDEELLSFPVLVDASRRNLLAYFHRVLASNVQLSMSLL